jgi:hypothetical protein
MQQPPIQGQLDNNAPPQGQPQMGKLIDQALSGLPDNERSFMAEMLTPETVHMISILFGDEYAKELKRYADPSVILVPVPRDEYMAKMQGQQGMQGQESPAPASEMAQPNPQQPTGASSTVANLKM